MSTKWLGVEDNINYIKNSITNIKTEKNADLIVFPFTFSHQCKD